MSRARTTWKIILVPSSKLEQTLFAGWPGSPEVVMRIGQPQSSGIANLTRTLGTIPFLTPPPFEKIKLIKHFFVLRTIWRPFVSSVQGMMPPLHPSRYATTTRSELVKIIRKTSQRMDFHHKDCRHSWKQLEISSLKPQRDSVTLNMELSDNNLNPQTKKRWIEAIISPTNNRESVVAGIGKLPWNPWESRWPPIWFCRGRGVIYTIKESLVKAEQALHTGGLGH